MQSEYRAFWNEKMWEVTQIHYCQPQTVGLADGVTEHINVPFEKVVLMRNTGKIDISGEFIYEGDFIESHQGMQVLDILMLVKYGTYKAYCPADREFMDNVGFYVEAAGYSQMPLGPLKEYARVIGNAYENSDWLNMQADHAQPLRCGGADEMGNMLPARVEAAITTRQR